MPDRHLVFVGDGDFAVLDLLYLVSSAPGIDLITPLCRDPWGEFELRALLATNLDYAPLRIQTLLERLTGALCYAA